MSPLLCKDCKWSRGNTALECDHPRNYKTNLVTGEKEIRFPFCTTLREAPWLLAVIADLCGKIGIWFEPKDIK